jgi:hypothetical protein
MEEQHVRKTTHTSIHMEEQHVRKTTHKSIHMEEQHDRKTTHTSIHMEEQHVRKTTHKSITYAGTTRPHNNTQIDYICSNNTSALQHTNRLHMQEQHVRQSLTYTVRQLKRKTGMRSSKHTNCLLLCAVTPGHFTVSPHTICVFVGSSNKTRLKCAHLLTRPCGIYGQQNGTGADFSGFPLSVSFHL